MHSLFNNICDTNILRNVILVRNSNGIQKKCPFCRGESHWICICIFILEMQWICCKTAQKVENTWRDYCALFPLRMVHGFYQLSYWLSLVQTYGLYSISTAWLLPSEILCMCICVCMWVTERERIFRFAHDMSWKVGIFRSIVKDFPFKLSRSRCIWLVSKKINQQLKDVHRHIICI
jgi:hypothetical protein